LIICEQAVLGRDVETERHQALTSAWGDRGGNRDSILLLVPGKLRILGAGGSLPMKEDCEQHLPHPFALIVTRQPDTETPECVLILREPTCSVLFLSSSLNGQSDQTRPVGCNLGTEPGPSSNLLIPTTKFVWDLELFDTLLKLEFLIYPTSCREKEVGWCHVHTFLTKNLDIKSRGFSEALGAFPC
jgi:hypothetical protein